MSWITDAFAKAKKALGFKDAGEPTQKCPLAETGLIVAVGRQNLKTAMDEPVEGAIVDIAGKSPFSKKTNQDGVASFKPVEPDTYTIKVTVPAPNPVLLHCALPVLNSIHRRLGGG